MGMYSRGAQQWPCSEGSQHNWVNTKQNTMGESGFLSAISGLKQMMQFLRHFKQSHDLTAVFKNSVS